MAEPAELTEPAQLQSPTVDVPQALDLHGENTVSVSVQALQPGHGVLVAGRLKVVHAFA